MAGRTPEGRVPAQGAVGRVVLILSPERSGSTLLTVMLGGHSRLFSPPELHLLRYPDFASFRAGYPAAMASLSSLMEELRLDYEEDRLDHMFAGMSTPDVYRWILARCPQGSFLVDKTPAYSRETSTLERAETMRPHYVWLIRHPLGVAASKIDRYRARRRAENVRLMARIKYPLFALREGVLARRGKSVRRAVAYWVDVHERIRAFLERVPEDRRRVVHYEKLVAEPLEAMEQLCQWLGLEVEPPMLDPRGRVPKGLTWGVGDEKILRHSKIDPSVAGRWRKQFDPGILDERARRLMKLIGVEGTH